MSADSRETVAETIGPTSGDTRSELEPYREDMLHYLSAVKYTRDVYHSEDPSLVALVYHKLYPPEAPEKPKKELTRRSFLKVGRNTLLVAGYAALASKLFVEADQTAGELIWPTTSPVSHEVTGPDIIRLRPTHGTFVLGGFGVKNAQPIAEALKPSLQEQGRVFGIEYDNAGIQITNLVNTIASEITRCGLSEISLYGHSMGGDVSLLVAPELLEKLPGLAIRNIMLDCTPSSIDAVRSKDKDSGTFWNKVRAYFNVHGGPAMRLVAELPNSPNTDFFSFTPYPPFVDASRLFNRIGVLTDEKFHSYSASNELLLEQFDTIVAMDIDSVFAALERLTEKQRFRPTITEIRPRNGSQDQTVFVDKSEEEFRAAAAEHDLDFGVICLDGDEIHHADPRASHDKYNASLLAMFYSQRESRRMHEEALQEVQAGEVIDQLRAAIKSALPEKTTPPLVNQAAPEPSAQPSQTNTTTRGGR